MNESGVHRNGRSGRGRGRGRSRGDGGGRSGPRSQGRGRQASPAVEQPITDGQKPLRRGGGRGGRMSGRAARGAGNTSNDNTAAATPSTRTRTEPSKKVLQNGEKGADAHTVSEADRIRLTKILMQLRESDQVQLEFPPTLTNTERKFLHQLAGQLGLVSKSTGKNEQRRIVVTKRAETTKLATTTSGALDQDWPILQVGNSGIQALKRYMNTFPPSHAETLESKETGASLVEAYSATAAGGTDGTDSLEAQDARIAATLQQLGLGSHDRVVLKEYQPKQIDYNYRRARHASYQEAKQKSNQYSRMMQQRQRLPAFARQQEIVDTVATNPVTIIQGETGCGKSTQCPQFLLDAIPTANIVVTQPRRISAISIAERIAQEQCLSTDNLGTLVGYQVRLEAASSKDTQLLFVTPGILLRRLQSSPQLEEFTHIVIDEIHERDKYTEFLLITLRDLLPKRPDLRLILMSATLQTELLIQYFASHDHDFYRQYPPAVLEIEGRTFPVQEFFLEHVLELTGYIDPAVAAAAAAAEPSSSGGQGTILSMEDLDAELAKLLNHGTDNNNPYETRGANMLQCPMCSQQFLDHVALGAHVALCQGINADTTTVGEIGTEILNDDHTGQNPILPILPTQLLTSDQLAGDIQDFDDYDVNENLQVDGYTFHIPSTTIQESSNRKENEEVDNVSKWDGIGLFLQPDENAEEQMDVTPAQDALLKHYQTMHDDEKVDTDLLMDVLLYINKSSYGDGAILVFLPGWQEISEFMVLLESTPPFHDTSKFLVLPLHSGIPSADQRRVLQRPPGGKRKIVLSTNIAETSLTIDDVSFVVDTGRAKEKDYDPHLKTSTLQPTWISQASSKQRKGRAGRTKAGVCFHLFSSRRYQHMRPFVESELLRTPLEEMCLFTKKLGLAPGGPEDPHGVPAFLARAITPPHEKSIANALELLVDLGAMLPETNDLTDLGQCLSILSLEPRVGKMVIWSYLLGCSRVISQMAIAMSYKSPFALPPPSMRKHAEKAQIEMSQGSESDQVTIYNAMIKHDQIRKKSGEGAWKDFCRRSFLSPATMQMISELRTNIKRELQSLNFPDPMQLGSFQNRNQSKEAIWQAALAAGLYPNVCTRRRGEVNFSTMTNRKCKIHVSSVNAVKGQPLNNKCQIPLGEVEFVCFGEMVKGAHMFTISQTTHIASPLPLLLLCGTALTVHPDPGNDKLAILGLDDWIVFKGPSDVVAMLVILRKRLDRAFLRTLAQSAFSGEHTLNSEDRAAIDVLGTVLQSAMKSSSVR